MLDKWDYFIMIETSIHQDWITILNVYISNKRASKYTRQKLIELHREIDKFTNIIRELNLIDRTNRISVRM